MQTSSSLVTPTKRTLRDQGSFALCHISCHTSSKNKKLAGVCGGLAEYLNIDVTVVRLIWAILSLFYGSGIIIYIICALVIPDDNIIDM